MTDIYWGNSPVRPAIEGGDGELVVRDGEVFYKISNYHMMPAFFMSIVSGFDHWMFVSSSGGLSCGRGNPESSLFPYYTDDKIHDAGSTTGPQTIFLVNKDARTYLWKPFGQDTNVYQIERNLYKNKTSNKLIFEEINHDFGLVFSYSWSNSDRYGFVKTSTILNTGNTRLEVSVLDGLRNLLPFGVTSQLQTLMSTLVDAYKQAEAFQNQTASVYTMSSILTDQAEPSEALKATAVWSTGLDSPKLLLSEDQVEAFCNGMPLSDEFFSKGKRGAFYVQSSFVIPPDQSKRWKILADIDQGPAEIAALLDSIDQGISALTIEKDIESGSERLLQLVGSADGCQLSSDELTTMRHFSNSLFNIMRGGTLYDEYRFPLNDFLHFAGVWNKPVQKRLETLLGSSGKDHTLESLLTLTEKSGDVDMQRIVLEYLPLTFSRRHGDPSRPWNKFSIDIRNADGSDKLHYQGNWRDIFQNWEALEISYPEFAESFISKFVNASTADGYNPYRLTKDGFEWEVLHAEDPWSNIGYWGDHQINYLLKLVEFSNRYHPGKIAEYLSRELFVYADVPYRIAGYQSLLSDPNNSVDYDEARAELISGRCRNIGSDGKLLTLSNGEICRASLLEKLLITTLTKLGNLVPGGGIWMNTRRPEWNDANNALVGYGLSMVTLCYLRPFLMLLRNLLDQDRAEKYLVSDELHSFYSALDNVFSKFAFIQKTDVSRQDRKAFMDELGMASEHYRASVYNGLSGHKSALSKPDLVAFIDLARSYLDHSISHNQRDDGLFHSYNLIQIEADGHGVQNLYEMLEGQVAVLESGYLDETQSLELLTALRSSKMYRPDQNSYILYPDRDLPLFQEKNVIDPSLVQGNLWIQDELSSGRKDFVEQDLNGRVHFNGKFRNAKELLSALDKEKDISAEDKQALCGVYESVFSHRQFTGRSGAMYKYEGLGCIYWHMVSKLLLATAKITQLASENGIPQQTLSHLLEHYDDIKNGLGLHKSPALYGAFPVDAYSHTTGFSGVQQPGLTGQVKEDVITRFYELGVIVSNGDISFSPVLIKQSEFISEPQTWHFSVGAEMQSEDLDAGSMAFTLCGVPVIYRLAENCSIQVFTDQADPEYMQGSCLGSTWSQSLFQRDKRVQKLIVEIPAEKLRP
ncbi:MAG: hypothetical protein OEU84_15950 [Xanthomonadales bacterium]|nr:hypothetical protein [Xanthomonadales bacterium]